MAKNNDHILTTFVKKDYSSFFSNYTYAIELERTAFKGLKSMEYEKENFYADLAEYLLGLVDDSNLQAKNFLLSSPVGELDEKKHGKLKASKEKYLIDHLVRKIITIAPDGIGITHSSNIYLDKETVEKIDYYIQLSESHFLKNVINPINKAWKGFGSIKMENLSKATCYAYQLNFYSEPNIGRFLSF